MEHHRTSAKTCAMFLQRLTPNPGFVYRLPWTGIIGFPTPPAFGCSPKNASTVGPTSQILRGSWRPFGKLPFWQPTPLNGSRSDRQASLHPSTERDSADPAGIGRRPVEERHNQDR